MIGGSTELSEASYPSLVEGVSLFLSHISDVELLGPIPIAVINPLIDMALDHLVELGNLPHFLESSALAVASSSTIMASSSSFSFTFPSKVVAHL